MTDAPERDADGRLKKGGPSLNRSGRPKKETKSYRDREQFSRMVIEIAERTSTSMSKDALAGMSLLERSTMRLALEAANGDVQASKNFIEYSYTAATYLENGRMVKVQKELAETKHQLAMSDGKAGLSIRQIKHANMQLADQLALTKEKLRKAEAEIVELKADQALR